MQHVSPIPRNRKTYAKFNRFSYSEAHLFQPKVFYHCVPGSWRWFPLNQTLSNEHCSSTLIHPAKVMRVQLRNSLIWICQFLFTAKSTFFWRIKLIKTEHEEKKAWLPSNGHHHLKDIANHARPSTQRIHSPRRVSLRTINSLIGRARWCSHAHIRVPESAPTERMLWV